MFLMLLVLHAIVLDGCFLVSTLFVTSIPTSFKILLVSSLLIVHLCLHEPLLLHT